MQLVVQYLGLTTLTNPTKPGDKGSSAGVFPLHLACRSGQTEVVQYITEMTIASHPSTSMTDIFSLPRDGNRRSPIWYAVVGLAGCGSTGIDRRSECVRIVWNSLTHIPNDSERTALIHTTLTEELRSLSRLKLPDKLLTLITQLLALCEKGAYSAV